MKACLRALKFPASEPSSLSLAWPSSGATHYLISVDTEWFVTPSILYMEARDVCSL